MQSEEREQGPQLTGCYNNKNIALLTRKERDWLLGNLDLSNLKSSIIKKIQTFVNLELPLLIKNNLIISYEPESLEAGFEDGNYYDNSSLGKASLGKAKAPGYIISVADISCFANIVVVYCCRCCNID